MIVNFKIQIEGRYKFSFWRFITKNIESKKRTNKNNTNIKMQKMRQLFTTLMFFLTAIYLYGQAPRLGVASFATSR